MSLMASVENSSRTLSLRALFILGVLASLCVSDNVGPRLLPLPTLLEFDSASRQPGEGHTASRAPSHGRTAGQRVEMIAPQTRAGAERQSPQEAAHAPKFDLALPHITISLRRDLYPSVPESSTPFSRPKGRAPPRLV